MPEYVGLATLTFAAMTVHAVAGFGFAQFLAPALLLAQTGVEAVSSLLLLALLINGFIVAEGRPEGFRTRDLALVTPGAVIGLPIGALLVVSVDKRILQLLVGCAILFAAALQARARPPSPGAAAGRRGLPLATVAGGLSGVLTTATAIGAAPVILWLERRTSDGAQIRYGIALYSILLCAVGVTLLVAQAGGEATTGLGLALALAPIVVAGYLVGRRAFRRLGDGRYRSLVLGLVVVAGAASIVGGVL